MSKRLILRVSVVLATVFGFSLIVAVVPAEAQTTCTSALPDGVDVRLVKSVQGTAGPGAPITNRFTVTIETPGTLTTAPCDIEVRFEDVLQNQEVQSYSLGNTACDPDAPTGSPLVSCKFTFTNLNVNETHSRTFTISTEATSASGVCDDAVVQIEPPTPTLEPPQNLDNNDAERCAREPALPPPDGGGGGFDEDGGFGFDTGGFGGFGTGRGFSTVSTPLGGVDTGAGGTARSSAAVPQMGLASLLAIGLLLLGLRRFGRA